MTKEEASKAIAEKIAEAEKLLNEATIIADEHDIYVRWNGPAYGMGGSYTPKSDLDEYDDEYDDNSWCYSGGSKGGWRSSSQGC